MSETPKKTEGDKDHVRCNKCSKLLAKYLSSQHIEIKCPRCGAVEVAFKKDKLN